MVIGRSRRHADAWVVDRELRRRGHSVAYVDDRKLRQLIGGRAGSEWIRARAAAFRPERILTFKPYDITLDVYAWLAARWPVTLWWRDLIIPVDQAIADRGAHAEVTYVAAGGQISQWEAAGAHNVQFLPSAGDAEESTPRRPDPDLTCDVAFVGRGYDTARAEFLCRLAERFDVRVWGQAWDPWAERLRWDGTTAYGEKFGRVCASARIILDIQPSFQVEEGVWGYVSNRVFRVMATGAFLLAHATPGVDALLTDGVHAGFYDDEESAVQRIAHWLADDEGRARVAAAGRAFVLEHHTYAARLPYLLTGAPWVNPLDGGQAPGMPGDAA